MKAKLLTDEQYNTLMERARKVNTQRDAFERGVGFTALSDTSAFEQMCTAKDAIECGIRTQDWNVVAEALDILEKIEQRFAILGVRRGM